MLERGTFGSRDELAALVVGWVRARGASDRDVLALASEARGEVLLVRRSSLEKGGALTAAQVAAPAPEGIARVFFSGAGMPLDLPIGGCA